MGWNLNYYPGEVYPKGSETTEVHLAKKYVGTNLAKHTGSSFVCHYKSEPDMSPELGSTEALYFQLQICVY